MLRGCPQRFCVKGQSTEMSGSTEKFRRHSSIATLRRFLFMAFYAWFTHFAGFVLNLTHVSINVIIPSLVSEMVDELEEEVMLYSLYSMCLMCVLICADCWYIDKLLTYIVDTLLMFDVCLSFWWLFIELKEAPAWEQGRRQLKMSDDNKTEQKRQKRRTTNVYLKMRESRENFRSCPQPWLLLMALASTIGGE